MEDSLICTPYSREFLFQGVFDDPLPPPPPPQEFPKFLNGDFSPPLEIQSGFGTLKKESEY